MQSVNSIDGAKLLSVRCAATLCRTVVETDGGKQQHLAERAAWLPPFNHEAFYAYDQKEPLTTVIYSARPGFSLPRS